MGAIDIVEVNHRIAFVRFAFTTCLDARLTADAAIGIDKEFVLRRNSHYRSLAFFIRTAHTLYSGIFEIGSCAEIVNWFALFLPGQ